MKNRILAISIIFAALAGIVVFLIVMTSWVNGIINAPDCDGTTQNICRVVPADEQPPVPKPIPLPTAEDVEAKINNFRALRDLPGLDGNVPALDQAAQVRAEGMCATDDWSHAKDWDVLRPYYAYSYAGENLYFASLRENQASSAVESWAESPGHLANMIGDYSQMGVGVKSCPGFQGSPTAVIITNYFGVPR